MTKHKHSRKIDYKKPLILIVLTIAMFFITASLYSFAFGKTTRVIINGKIYGENEYQVYYTTPQVKEYTDNLTVNVKVEPSNEFQSIYFEVHEKDLHKLRIDFGQNPGEVDIKYVTIEQSFKKLTLYPSDIKRVFSRAGQDIEKNELRDDILYVYSAKPDPYISCDNFQDIFKTTPLNLVKLSIILIVSILLSTLIYKGYNNLVERKISPKNWAFIAGFITIICFPGLFNYIGIYPGENTEKRELAPKPVFKLNKDTIVSYPKAYEDYENDNFGMKNYLVKYNNYINYNLLKTSPMDSVLLGKEGWLYYAKEGNINMVEDYRGITMFTDEELKTIRDNLVQQRDWLKDRGIPFVLLMAPNKESIYSEYLPDNIKKVQQQNRMDQIIVYLKKNSDLNVIDIRDELMSKKSMAPLYYRTDSHWNELGAFFGQKAIMDEVHKYIPSVKSKELSDFKLINEPRDEDGDLAKMLNLQDYIKEDNNIHVQPKIPYEWHTVNEYSYNLTEGMVTENDNNKLPRLLMFRDSYTINMQPYISDYFSTAVYQWNHSFDPKLVEDVKPDIVVHEVVERYIFELLTQNPESMKK